MYSLTIPLNQTTSILPRLHGFLTEMRSHCSHYLRDIGVYPPSRPTAPLKKEATSTGRDNAKQKMAEKLLSRINHDAQEHERLQLYDPKQHELWFACGNGTTAVFVSSQGQVKEADKPLRSKLTRELVETIRSNPQPVDGKELLSQVTEVLKDYLHFEDKRLYLLQALWIMGTYTYLISDN